MTEHAPPHTTLRHWAATMLAHRRPDGGVHHDGEHGRAVYQTSTMGALLDGVYDGTVTVAELLAHGDFGLGTFNGLDGEMLILDGVCHRLRADGSATIANPGEFTPFATVTWFSADHTFDVGTPTDRATLLARIDAASDGPNLIYAIRVIGRFASLRTRTVHEQHQPYPPLAQATADQQETEFTDISGVLAGYRMPDYEQGVAVAGYHLHFLDEARRLGGHALDYRLAQGRVEISVRSELHLALPTSAAFLHADLQHHEATAEIRQSEGG
jgi:acetolactate decarboxylase